MERSQLRWFRPLTRKPAGCFEHVLLGEGLYSGHAGKIISLSWLGDVLVFPEGAGGYDQEGEL